MVYTQGQVRRVVTSLGIEIEAKTAKRFNCFCPFHDNQRTPAFSISRDEGLWICFNEDCGKRGNLVQLVTRLSERTEMEAMRHISNYEVEPQSLSSILDDVFMEKPEWPMFPQQLVDDLAENFWKTDKAIKYMKGRGFNEDTLRNFQVGYTSKLGGEVVFPVYNPDGSVCVGVVGRGVDSKFFDNSKNLPRNRILYNLSSARRVSDKVIVAESGFDAQRIYQAGHRNVVATLGSSVSDEQVALMERNFVEIVIFSDNDPAGMAMRQEITALAKSVAVLHAAADYGTLYPERGIKGGPPKDAGDLSIEQINGMINNALHDYEIALP